MKTDNIVVLAFGGLLALNLLKGSSDPRVIEKTIEVQGGTKTVAVPSYVSQPYQDQYAYMLYENDLNVIPPSSWVYNEPIVQDHLNLVSSVTGESVDQLPVYYSRQKTSAIEAYDLYTVL